MPDGISRETFKGYDTAGKLNTLFDYMVDTRDRVIKLEKRKWFNTGASTAGGVFGGMITVLGAMKYKLFGGG